MKCKGCEAGLPIMVIGGQAVHYTMGAPELSGPLCEEQGILLSEAANDDLALWEAEGGRVT